MMEEKKVKRNLMKKNLKEMSLLERKEMNKEILSRVENTREWKEARTIGITLSLPFEVETRDIIEKAWGEGKRVAVPKCFPQTHKMEFYQLSSFTELETVQFGIEEPLITAEKIAKEELDVIFVPGVIFAKNGYRVGFGGGYYDRYLQNYRGKKISIAFHIQIADFVPIESHDIPVGKIITNQEVLICE
ncbi:5-formyltetrahydrofolate cyclo-ligase [Priestia endophytica]|jgi:5-formyltetrahydrofolate cyclo-ligase|nr:5-formyltetrahydrofolate cyclo-ligase [Priestia endophytica]